MSGFGAPFGLGCSLVEVGGKRRAGQETRCDPRQHPIYKLCFFFSPACQPFLFIDVPDVAQMFTQRIRSPSIISSLPFLQLVPTAPRSDQDFFVTELFQDPLQLSTAAMKHLKGMIDGGNLMVWLCFSKKKEDLFLQCLCRGVHHS